MNNEIRTRKHEFSPSPSEVLRYLRVYLRRSSEQDREKSKAADWVTAVSTALGLIAAIASAIFLYGQLRDAQKNFRLDERAWVELEGKNAGKVPMGDPSRALAPAYYKYQFLPKNVGKTVATDVIMNIFVMSTERFTGPSDKELAAFLETAPSKAMIATENGTTVGTIVSFVPKVLAPNASATVPAVVTARVPHHRKIEAKGDKVQVKDLFPATLSEYDCIIGTIDYKDVFEKRHSMMFCYVVLDENGNLETCDNGNEEK